MTNINLEEKLANLGYLALKKETTKGVAVTPDVFIPLYEESIKHDIHLDEDKPIVGERAARFKVYRGQETITGSLKVLGEPQTIGYFFDMLLKKESTSGTPTTGYTHTFGLGDSSNSYTLEFLKGGVPVRLIGTEARSISPSFEDNKMVLNVDVSARSQFSVVKIKSASGTAITLDDSERPMPSEGLTTSDKLRLYDVSAGTYEDVTITSIDSNGKDLVVSTITGTYTAGDLAYLAPLTPTYSIGEPFNWALTQFKFGENATAALSATPIRMEADSNWTVMFNMEDESGALRSGGYQPASFVRTVGDVEVSLKKFFDDSQELDRFLQVTPRALVIEHTSPSLAGTNGTKSLLRITIDEYYIKEYDIPIKSDEIIYSTITLAPVYNVANSEMFKIELITSEDTI